MDTTTLIRLSLFAGALIIFSTLETLFPKRQRVHSRLRRLTTNLTLVVIGSFSLALLGPLIAVGMAAWATHSGWGVLNLFKAPVWVEFIIAFICLDLAIWYQHLLFHKFPWLWRLHSVHHADRDLDASSGVRFHPLEIMLSMLYKCGVVLLLGPSVFAVIVFEIILNATAIFNHANLSLPPWLDRILRKVIVTPDMHRVHHSVILEESRKNYGFNLSFWDRIFQTYQESPIKGQIGMTLGLETAQTNGPQKLLWSLFFPFKDLNTSDEKAP